jgi:hypothetical protein
MIAQQGDLSVCGKVADFVEKDRTTLCQFEGPKAALVRSRECALFMTK